MPNTKGNKAAKSAKPRIKGKLKVAMLGGLNEIGKNIAVIEFGSDIIVVDCGLGFPDDDMLGVDLVIPDVGYLEKNIEKVRGIFLTHGHEDHIGRFTEQGLLSEYFRKSCRNIIMSKFRSLYA